MLCCLFLGGIVSRGITEISERVQYMLTCLFLGGIVS